MVLKYLEYLACPVSNNKLRHVEDKREMEVFIESLCESEKASLFHEGVNRSELTGLLRADDGGLTYPIFNDIPFLKKEYCYLNGKSCSPVSEYDQYQSKLQQKQMNIFSANHKRWYDYITDRLKDELKRRYGHQFKGAMLIDLGNGGNVPEKVVGDSVANGELTFVGLDKSYPMLVRNGYQKNQILADAESIPFKDNSFDYSLANCIIHHLGQDNEQSCERKLNGFLKEALRVSRKGVIVLEMVIPYSCELIERSIARFTKAFPTYVYSRKRLLKFLKNNGYDFSEPTEKRLTDIVGSFYHFPPILDFPWFRVPSFVVPYSYLYFMIKKSDCHS